MLQCPDCQFCQAEANSLCARCGRSLPPALRTQVPLASRAPASEREKTSGAVPLPAFSPPQPHSVKTLLPSVALFAAALLLIAYVVWPGRPSASGGIAGSTPPAGIIAPTQIIPPSRKTLSSSPTFSLVLKPGPKPTRLTADVFCTQSGKPLPVGSRVMLTALADADPGRTVTLVLSCRRGSGPASLLSLAEGRLCSVAWTPVVPGRYQFTATVSDDHARAAVSRPLLLTVGGSLAAAALPPRDRPSGVRPLPDLPAEGALPALPPMAYVLPPQRARLRLVRLSAASARLPALTPLLPPIPSEAISPAPSPKPLVPKAAPALYHVVVATFPAARNAVVLAKSFWGRGVKVAVQDRQDSQGRETYAVEMAASHNQETARQSALSLQRSGYPAYCFEGK